MMSIPIAFERPRELQASLPAELRSGARDGVRLLISDAVEDREAQFKDLATLLRPGDLLVVNESATLAASLPARGEFGEFRLNLSTRYARELWLAEPRWSHSIPGPLPLAEGGSFSVADLRATVVAPFPGIARLLFVRIPGDLDSAMNRVGEPIRYAYVDRRFGLATYQTIFARIPGSAEMPSAARPFTPRVLQSLRDRGVEIVPVLLHAGVSSLEAQDTAQGSPPVYPEPFEVPSETARAIRRVRRAGGRIIAVGTTVVRALESAVGCNGVMPIRGFTRTYLSPERAVRTVDGLLTGFHDSGTSHLALLESLVGSARVRRAYQVAVVRRFLWHEFGDSHLLWADSGPREQS